MQAGEDVYRPWILAMINQNYEMARMMIVEGDWSKREA
jgi:hypothetical protein